MQLAVDNQISDPIPYIITILGGRKKKPKKQQEMENVLEFLRKSREERLSQDDTGGFDGDGDPVLPISPDDEFGSVHEGGDTSFGRDNTRGSAKVSRPKGGHLGKVQIPSVNRGAVGYGQNAQSEDF